MLDLLTFGEALVEIMRPDIDQPLDAPGPFTGPHESGAPFIFAVQAARLGVRSGAVGCVGGDAFGRFLVQRFRAEGLDPRGLRVLDDHATGIAFVAYRRDDSRDFVFTLRDAACAHLTPDMLDEALFAGLRCLHVSGSAISINEHGLETGRRALELALSAGAKISFDLNVRPQLIAIERAREAFRPFLESADVIFGTPDELTAITDRAAVDEAARLLQSQKPDRLVVVHAGASGCVVYAAGERLVVPGFSVDEVDPTGAGDCFDAGFLVRWLSGASPGEAARMANACGALAVTARGPMAGARTMDEVMAFLSAREAALSHEKRI